MVYSFSPLLIYFANLQKKWSVIFQEKWCLWPGWWHSVEHHIEYFQLNCKGCQHRVNTHGNLLCAERNIVSFIVWQHCPVFFSFFLFLFTLYLTSVETFPVSAQITCRSASFRKPACLLWSFITLFQCPLQSPNLAFNVQLSLSLNTLPLKECFLFMSVSLRGSLVVLSNSHHIKCLWYLVSGQHNPIIPYIRYRTLD